MSLSIIQIIALIGGLFYAYLCSVKNRRNEEFDDFGNAVRRFPFPRVNTASRFAIVVIASSFVIFFAMAFLLGLAGLVELPEQ